MNIYCQDTCQKIPYHSINILNNPSFENPLQPCVSGFQNIPFWYAPTYEMLTGFLNSCTDFQISDSLMNAFSFVSHNICFFPVVPQPIPDGGGVVAVSDFGYDGAPYVYPFYKSYISTCLTGTLQKDSLYSLNFFVGFGRKGNKFLEVDSQLLIPEYSQSPEKFTLFGLQDCSGINAPIPFLGCLSVAGWIPLGSCTVSADTGTWVKASIVFSPAQNIQAVALGPSCDTNYLINPDNYLHDGQQESTKQFSYFLDKLQFNEANVPKPVVSLVSGNPCSSSMVLQMEPAAYYSGSSFQWYRNDTALSGMQRNTITITRTKKGLDYYSCQVQNDSLCISSNPFSVNWLSLPDASVLGASDTTACAGDTVFLNGFIDSSFTYKWQNGSMLPYLQATRNGIYSLTISNQCGTAHAQKTISFGKCDFSLSFPNAFTPNGDGLNDIFKARYTNSPQKFNMHIYNRNGQEVFSSSNLSEGWNGMCNGAKQPAGTYVWFVKYTDIRKFDHTLKGTVVLIR